MTLKGDTNKKLVDFFEGKPEKKKKAQNIFVFKKRKIKKRYFKKSLSLILNKRVAAGLAIFFLCFAFFFEGVNQTQGATYTFSQTDWSGGTDGGVYPSHPGDTSGWTKYDSKDSGVEVDSEKVYLNSYLESGNITLDTSSNYIQEDSINGTEISSGTAKLKRTGVTDSSLLLDFDGDSSSSVHTMNINGTPYFDGTTSKWGSSMYFDGDGDSLSLPDSDDWNFGSGNFTIDFWANFESTSGYGRLFGQHSGSESTSSIWQYIDSTKTYLFYRNESGTQNVSWDWVPLAGEWYHLAFVRNGSDFYFFVNGVSQGARTVSGTIVNSSANFSVYGNTAATTSYPGYIDEFRISKGTARWTSNFSVNTDYYSDDAYTKLLLHLNGDAASGNKSVYTHGDIQINGTTSKWGNSMNFDGSGDYLTLANSDDWNFGSGDFTIDFWVNSSATISSVQDIYHWTSPMTGIQIQLDTSRKIRLNLGNGSSWFVSGETFSTGLTSGQWQHVAIVKNGNNYAGYLDGVQKWSKTSSEYMGDASNTLYIGSYRDGATNQFNGYLDELRVSKGIARWTSGFSVPTSAYADSYYTDDALYITTSDTSQIDTSSMLGVSGVTLTQTTPTNTSIKYLISFDGRTTWKYYDGSAWQSSSLANLQTDGMTGTFLEGLNISDWSATGGFQYGSTSSLDFAFDISSTDSTVTPELDNIQVDYYSSGEYYFYSSYFDTQNTLNAMSSISWTENAATGSEIKFQLRTAPDNSGTPGTWTDWMGTDGTSSSYFTDSTGGDAIPSALSDNTGDQWFQYRIAFSGSTNLGTPEVLDVDVDYSFNAVPEIQNVTASQGSDGTVSISYEAKDSDTTSGSFTPGYVTPSFEYWNGSAWVACTTMASGDTDNKAVVEGSFTSYSATWTPKTDFDEEFMNGTAKIRVTINDNEGANNTASAESNTFTLDTTDPTGLSLVIDHTLDSLILGTPSDDSSYQMAVSNLSNFSGATYVAFSSPYSYASMTSDPATVYVRIKDAYGNYTDVSATTPNKPENLTYYDVTDTANEEYRELIAWGAISAAESGSGFSSYDVYRSTDGETYSLLTSISDRLLNFYVDSDVSLGSTYYYKIFTEDTAGNKSAYSEIVSDVIDGQGSSDSTPPTISNVQVSGIQTTSATITWDTDEVSNSSVGYSTDATYLPEIGSSYMGTEHEITLTGLTPGTEYNIRVQSQDAAGNLGQNDKDDPGSTPIANFTFETLPGPAISSVTIPQVYNNQATIEWTTTTDSATYVVYSDSVSGGALVDPIEIGTPDLVGGSSPYNHSQTITELSENTRYYFYVKSVDASDNVAIDNNGGEFYELLTTQDDNAPELSSIETAIVSDTEAAIHWVTDEQATSKVKYATSSGGPYTDTSEVTVMSRSHYVILTGLSADTDYYYKVISSDINENEAMSAEYEFTTLKNPEYQHDALSEITDVTESIITDEKAVVKFDTDEGAQCSVEFGTESGNYTEVPVSETDYDKDHSIHLTGLIFSTTYYYQITCADNLDNVVSADEESFTTLALQEDVGGGDTTAPEISGVDVGTITGESVTVTWDTDEASNSLVRYGITEDFGSMAGDDLVNIDKDNYITSHEVIINNLVPDTKYYYAVMSIDTAGNIGESSQGDFSTKAASSLSSINIESNSLNEVTITWKSSEKTTSVVEYGLTEEYGDKKESSSSTKEHSVSLSGLKSNETYHFRVKGKDEDDNWYSSGDYTLEPKSPPNISDIQISEITEHGAKITFSTNVPTDALITYASTDGESSGSQGKPDLSVKHEIELVGLESGTNFGFTIKANDEDGNSTESEERSFQTGKDENAPVIEQIKTDSGLALNDKVQTIITWGTDEATNAKLIYKEGKNGEEKEMEVDESFSLYHIAVLTEFKSGTVYYFKVKSADVAGNETVSEEYALLTPKKKENIVQVIISNFEDIFGWAKVGG